MPFNWKNKTRRNRFSQLVADHLQSPKRGGSLVVETGFPTSIIDLYVRNRGRFRKSSEKKQRANDSPNQSSSSGSLADLNSFSSSSSFVDSNNSYSGDSDCRRTDEIVDEDVILVGVGMVLSEGADSDVAHASGSVFDSNNSLSSDLGEIMEDAILVSQNGPEIENCREIEAERGVGMTKLNSVLVIVLKVLFMAVLVFGTKRFRIAITLLAFLLCFVELVGKRLFGSVDSKQTATLVVCSEVLEIEEQLESKQEECSEKESDEVRNEVLIEITRKSSRRAMMKSRIKKLVPKKLRNRKSAQNVKPNECSDSKGKIVESGRRSLSSTLSSETGTNLQQNCGFLVLFLIVLVGLIGGRVLALVMALSWCLMLKLQWRYAKVPMF